MERLNLTGNKTLANPGGYMANTLKKMNDTSTVISFNAFYPPPSHPSGQILDPSL